MGVNRKTLTALTLALVATLLTACTSGGHPKPSFTPGASPSVGLLSPTPGQPAVSITVPEGLPQRLGLGLMNNPLQLDWMTSSGIPWDYRYQYLTGGVNTGDGWTTWGSPQGSFVDEYLQDSAKDSYVPVFSYYQIVASAPDPGSEDILPKLRNADTMRAYYDDWVSLMREFGSFGKTVLVHVEPDLWGYLQQENSDASKIAMSVESSGQSDVADFDDSASGFTQALVHIRDLYAPNALLGFHVSSWGTGEDLIVNQADPLESAREIAAFYQTLSADFDLLFFDVSDRDAGWYEVQRDLNSWWTAEDFDRFGSFLGATVSDIGKPAIIWQIPVGNTLFQSMDNSWGHYQDNRVQTWLGDPARMQQLAAAGVIALLFGAGADGCTMYDDEMQDGVTNPASIDGNNQTAQYTDDDGGYLRIAAADYYEEGQISQP
jgi:hypothetical protein